MERLLHPAPTWMRVACLPMVLVCAACCAIRLEQGHWFLAAIDFGAVLCYLHVAREPRRSTSLCGNPMCTTCYP